MPSEDAPPSDLRRGALVAVLAGAGEVRPLRAPGGDEPEPRRRSRASAPPVAARALRGVVPPLAAAARAEGLPGLRGCGKDAAAAAAAVAVAVAAAGAVASSPTASSAGAEGLRGRGCREAARSAR